MAQSKRERYERKREHVRELAAEGAILPEDATVILNWCDGYDGEKATTTPTDADHETNRWGETRAATTLRQWLVATVNYAREIDGSLLDATADDFNQASQAMYEGTAAGVTRPLSKNSVRTRQNCIKKFLRHAEGAADPDGIAVFDAQSTIVDPEDMLTRDEFQALRNAPEHPRDRAIVDLFLYTGQRNTAIRTLRIKDVDLDEGKYRLNGTADGLKGADLVGTWNPLLVATGSIRHWLNHHPDPDNPEAYLLTERRDSLQRDATSTISDDTVNRTLREASKRAAREHPSIKNKPTHAHAMRHNFVTMCKREYGLDDDVIKRLIRHKPESDVMNTTYAHLSDDDYIQKAEEAFGLREEEESTFTPEYCSACRQPIDSDAKACQHCGTVLTPDARSAMDQLDRDIKQDLRETDPEDTETMSQLDALDALTDDPEQKAVLADVLNISARDAEDAA